MPARSVTITGRPWIQLSTVTNPNPSRTEGRMVKLDRSYRQSRSAWPRWPVNRTRPSRPRSLTNSSRWARHTADFDNPRPVREPEKLPLPTRTSLRRGYFFARVPTAVMA